MARPGLTTHRKFRRLAKQLGSVPLARGVLELIWESCYESGEDYIGTGEDIEQLIGWTGERGIVALALVAAGLPEGHGFIEPIPAEADGEPIRYRVHDLWHHAPDDVAKRRKREEERRNRMVPVSTERRRTADNGGQRPPPPDSQTGVDRTPSPSPRTEQQPTKQVVACAEPPSDSTPAVLRFPVVGDPAIPEWALTQARIDAWLRAYPNLDVAAECRKALAWVEANRNRRKTAKGMPAFLVNWLHRAVSRGGALVTTPSARKVPSWMQ